MIGETHLVRGMKYSLSKIISILLLMLLPLAGCSPNRTGDELTALVADSASDVHREKLGSPAVTQLSYQAKIPYPQRAVSDKNLQAMIQRGWRQCSEFGRGEWEHFGDSTVTPPRIVHQYLLSFAKDTEYMVIAMRYLSGVPAKDPTETNPDNDDQHVYILHYDLKDNKVREEMDRVVKTCSAAR